MESKSTIAPPTTQPTRHSRVPTARIRVRSMAKPGHLRQVDTFKVVARPEPPVRG